MSEPDDTIPASLQTYRAKRHFGQTPEPEGGWSEEGEPLRFVVQKHHASQLHYDFRLELDSVLKSWAVPKGPSMNPAEKRLAMMVEDHPLDYRRFEGTIPRGNYGAGTVMVWDEGTYGPAGTPLDRAAAEAGLRHGLERGNLRFVLAGTKLRGEFTLVKVKGREPNAWLLIKKADDAATAEDVRQQDRSVLSGRTMDQIAAGPG